jgi:urease accessory protein UreF
MDRAERHGEELVTSPVIPALVEEQRKASAEAGCAFFSLYQAMGGRGSMATWVRRGLGQADLTHPTGVGAEILASWIYRALLAGFTAERGRDGPP